jgi:hypothetical protein
MRTRESVWTGFQNKPAAAGAPAFASMLTTGYFFFSIKAGKEPLVLFIRSQPATSDILPPTTKHSESPAGSRKTLSGSLNNK